VDEVKL